MTQSAYHYAQYKAFQVLDDRHNKDTWPWQAYRRQAQNHWNLSHYFKLLETEEQHINDLNAMIQSKAIIGDKP